VLGVFGVGGLFKNITINGFYTALRSQKTH